MTEERKSETPGMAEVSPKFVDEAEAAVAAPPSSASVPGDPLLEIIRKYHEADAASDRTFDSLDEAEGDARKRGADLPSWGLVRVEVEGRKFDWSKGEIETAATAAGLHGVNLTVEQRDTYLAQLDELRRKGLERFKELGLDTLYLKNERCREAFWKSFERVCETPAVSVEGFAAKVLVLCKHWDWGEGGSPIDDLMSSLKPDAERLGRFPAAIPTIEDPILALKREWGARYKALDEQRDTGDDSDEARQPFYDRLQETEQQILRTQATTPAGIAVKLILWARLHCTADEVSGLSWNRKSIEGHLHDLDRLPVLSALVDLERMATTTTVAETPPAEDAALFDALAEYVRLVAISEDLERRKEVFRPGIPEAKEATEVYETAYGKTMEAWTRARDIRATTQAGLFAKLQATVRFMTDLEVDELYETEWSVIKADVQRITGNLETVKE